MRFFSNEAKDTDRPDIDESDAERHDKTEQSAVTVPQQRIGSPWSTPGSSDTATPGNPADSTESTTAERSGHASDSVRDEPGGLDHDETARDETARDETSSEEVAGDHDGVTTYGPDGTVTTGEAEAARDHDADPLPGEAARDHDADPLSAEGTKADEDARADEEARADEDARADAEDEEPAAGVERRDEEPVDGEERDADALSPAGKGATELDADEPDAEEKRAEEESGKETDAVVEPVGTEDEPLLATDAEKADRETDGAAARHAADEEDDHVLTPVVTDTDTAPATANGAEPEVAAVPVAAGAASPVAGAEAAKPGTVESPVADRLFTDGDSFAERFRDIQLRFVDSPKEATAEAAGLIGEAVDRLTAALNSQKDALTSNSDDTEKLRVELRGYRDLLNRLTSL